MDVKVTAVQWCSQQLKEFFADEIHRIRYKWDACCLSHNNPERVALWKDPYQDGVTFCGIFKFHENFYIVSEVIQGDIHVDTVLFLAENSGLAVLNFRCSKCTWSEDGCLLSVFVSSVVFSGTAIGRSLVHEFARDGHKQDLQTEKGRAQTVFFLYSTVPSLQYILAN
jgi:hypothetical protein